MRNNNFLYEGQYYHQIRGGAMGSPLTLTIANCYMFFFERDIVKQIINGGGSYLRYIDDMFIIINWSERHLNKQIDQWNLFDLNIQLKAQAGSSIDFLDLSVENVNGHLLTKVYHKPSHEPYYLPFNSVHPMHMKKNIPFAMLLRAIRYCSTFKAFLNEREDLRMALLLNKYPCVFIDKHFNRVLQKFNINQPLTIDYSHISQHHPDFDSDSDDSSGEDDEDTTGNFTDSEDSTENNEDYVSNHLFKVSSTTFQRMRVFDSINPTLAKSYFIVNINGTKIYLLKQTAAWLLSNDISTLCSDRLKRVMNK
ncbi:unnamed protein product [Rotaria magnacalcarata]|uniref:Helix-turn-helix domain-containing protein n=1 Tax=Rotaria magnacalcarata TaxID=392030 RepID=A0A816RD28_9BILA|nr:unnamed protein product [Rotaria magnacalcarata]